VMSVLSKIVLVLFFVYQHLHGSTDFSQIVQDRLFDSLLLISTLLVRILLAFFILKPAAANLTATL